MKRALFELAELMTPKKVTEDELKGRSSGSLSWKLSRGEQNINTVSCERATRAKNNKITDFCATQFYVFNAAPEDHAAKQFNCRYSCAKNQYERFVRKDDGCEIFGRQDKWEACHYLSTNMFRKHERDWKMVYLARVEMTDDASIEWKFDFGDLTVATISLRFETKTYETGSVKLVFLNQNGTVVCCNYFLKDFIQ